MDRHNKKKVGRVDFDRIGRVGKYFHKAPSSYFPSLDEGEALMFDEVCVIIMEDNNEKYLKEKKRREKEKKDREEFHKTMDKIFLEDDGEVW